MILVTQGHEKGIGLEVFFKALLLAPRDWSGQCRLFAHKKTVQTHLKKLGLNAEVSTDGVTLSTGLLSCEWLSPASKLPASTQAMEATLAALKENPRQVLFTLPTSKDELRNPKKPQQRFLGHTEYLRAHHKAPELGMFFSSPKLSVLLLTDHLPLAQVAKELTPGLFKAKLLTSLKELRVLEPGLKHALIAGLNPHAGEGGLLGKEEMRLQQALAGLKVPGFSLEGFYSGDALLAQRKGEADLLVYTHHDQGLAPYKALMGTLGANVTLGLPYVRLSVDHGTAFALYGKNMADPRGALYCLRKGLSYQERFCGKNPDHQGPRP